MTLTNERDVSNASPTGDADNTHNSSMSYRQQPSRARKWLVRAAIAAVALVVAFISFAWLALRASIPETDGNATINALDENVTIIRDHLGIPAIHASSYKDAVTGLGFVHGQDRFFQMDLVRRYTAGELAEMLGDGPPRTVDESMRLYRYRAHARNIINALSDEDTQLLNAYVDGVNAGLQSLNARPPEYWILRTKPEPWTAEDAILVKYYFFQALALNARYEAVAGVMHDALPPDLYEFLTPDTTRFDRPLLNTNPEDPTGGYTPTPIPGPEILDLRDKDPADFPADLSLVQASNTNTSNNAAVGSNAWAVAGMHTEHGGAILANDPHLQLTCPGIWYRAELHWKEGDTNRVARGVTAAGLPGIAIGANDHIAWGFTNLYSDQDDLVIVEFEPGTRTRYLTPDGPAEFTVHNESINVRGKDPVTIQVKETIWGPILDDNHNDQPIALRSTALSTKSMTPLLQLDQATSLEHGLDVAAQWYGPAQSVMIVDTNGDIGWTCSGYLPKRIGFDGKRPRSWADGTRTWDDDAPQSERPRILRPDNGMLFAANGRIAEVERARTLGHAWAPSTRTHRIHTLLTDQTQSDQPTAFNEAAMLALQCDTRVELFDTARDLILRTIADDTADPSLRTLRDAASAWDGTANADQFGFLVVRTFHRELKRMTLSPLVKPCTELDPEFEYEWMCNNEPFFRLLEEEPEHLVSPRYRTWNALYDAAALATARALMMPEPTLGDVPRNWGEANQLLMTHPLGDAVPLLGKRMNMPVSAQSGHADALRVAGHGFGASMRMVVSPDHIEDAILHMPAGQSGHFLSNHYQDQHLDWLLARPAPLAARTTPGKARSTWQLAPR